MNDQVLKIWQSIAGSLEKIAAYCERQTEPVGMGGEIVLDKPRKRAPKHDYFSRDMAPHDKIMMNAGMKVNITRFRVACAHLGIKPEQAPSGSCRWYIPKKDIPAVVKKMNEILF